MIRAVMFLAMLILLVCCAACDAGDFVGPPSASRSQESPAAVVVVPSASEVPPNATTTPPVEEPRTSERTPAIRAAPRTLAVSWSAYLGRRVLLSCRPVRRIDLTRTLVVAGGERFVVTGPARATPCGATTSTFIVMSSTTVPIAGRTVLPELLLEDDGDGDDGAR